MDNTNDEKDKRKKRSEREEGKRRGREENQKKREVIEDTGFSWQSTNRDTHNITQQTEESSLHFCVASLFFWSECADPGKTVVTADPLCFGLVSTSSFLYHARPCK